LNTSINSSFANQGEICLCGSRIFVQEDIYERFVKEFTGIAKQMKVGNPLDPLTQVGALVSEQHMQKVLSYIEIAKNEGAIIHCGGKKVSSLDGFFVPPTVITGVHPTKSRCQMEEIFGPVVTITPFKTEEEVIAYSNSTEYGLSASVWSENGRKAHRVARQLSVGTCWINCWLKRDLNMPFGGQKNSGLGREGKSNSAHFFCEVLET
jgi:aminomuconate-semialdehyde/2-hydroxymuconate-6-semialdehyde dehydrogenase